MLRVFQEVVSSPADTMYKAENTMKTGVGVVADYSTLTFALPTSEAGFNVSLLDKERVATGIHAGRGEMSDYDEHYVTVEKDEGGKLFNFDYKSVFGTDQFDDAGLISNVMVSMHTDGLWRKATVPSVYQFTGIYNDNGHNLARIKVLQTPVTNA